MTGAGEKGPAVGSRTSIRALHAMAGLGATGMSRFVVAVMIGRVGGPHLLGLTQSVLSSAQVASLVGPTSLGSAASRFVAAARGRGDTATERNLVAYFLSTGIRLGIGIGLLASAVVYVAMDGEPRSAICVGLVTIAFGTYAVSKGVLNGGARTLLSMKLEVLIALISVLGTGGALLLGVRSVWVVLPVAIGYLAYSLVVAVGVDWERRASSETGAIGAFVGFGLLGTLASAGFAQAGVFVSGGMGGTHGAGQYAAALALAAPAGLLASALAIALFPVLSEMSARGDLAAANRHTVKATKAMVVLIIAVLGPAAIVAPAAIRAMWGHEFETAASIAYLLLTSAAVNAISVPAVNALTSRSVDGMKISAASSLAGAACGALYWLVKGPTDMTDIGQGVLVGTLVFSGLPVVFVSIRDRPSWARTWIMAMTGLAAMAYFGRLAIDLQWMHAILLSLAFLVVWTSLNQRLLRTILRRATNGNNNDD